MPSIHDVAARAGVSTATVSRVFNDRSVVADETAEKVLAAVAELGYRRNASARALRRQVSDTWAVIVPDFENPFFTAAVRGITDIARPGGFSTVLSSTNEDGAEEAQLIEVAVEQQVAGVILCPTGNATELEPLIQSQIPVVVIDRRPQGVEVDSVTVDNRLGAGEAAQLLHQRGVKVPACITGPRRASTAVERLEGFRQTVTTLGLALPRTMIRYADFRYEGGKAAAESLLDSATPPDGIFVANNLMTLGVLEVLDQRGISIPDDLVLVGFDEIPWAGLLRPQLSVIVQPGVELGRQAARLLLDRIVGFDGPSRQVVLRAEVREPAERATRSSRRSR